MPVLILLRHGESVWNRDDRFAGWTDVELTPTGEEQAREAGRRLLTAGILPDVAYTSRLRRSLHTLRLCLEAMDCARIPVHRDWRLNERHYGLLEGESKSATVRRMGDGAARALRRGLRVRPPALPGGDPRHPRHNPVYRDVPADVLPTAESLEDTLERLLPYWRDVIAPALAAGQTTLVCAHTHSLRALLHHLDEHTPLSIESIEIPPATPLVYRLDAQLRPSTRDTLLA